MKIGAVWVPLNIALTGGDLAYSLDDAAPRVLVVDADTRPRIDELAARRTLPLRLYQIGADGPEGFASLLDAAAPVPEVPVEPGDPAVIIYTGGTTRKIGRASCRERVWQYV